MAWVWVGRVADVVLYHPVNIDIFCTDVKMSHFILFEPSPCRS